MQPATAGLVNATLKAIASATISEQNNAIPIIRRYGFNMIAPLSSVINLTKPRLVRNDLPSSRSQWVIALFLHGLLVAQVFLGATTVFAATKPKIFVGYIDKNPEQPPVIIISILEKLTLQLAGLATKTVEKLPGDWSIPNNWSEVAGQGYTHFIVGGVDASMELQNRYKQPTWIIGKISRDRDGQPHLIYYGALALPLWSSKEDVDVFKYVCEGRKEPLANGSVDCMIPMFASNAATLIRDRFYFIFPELREKYVFLLRCVQAPAPDADVALNITQRLWDGLSGFADPFADWWSNVDTLKKACGVNLSESEREPEFEIRGGYFSNITKKALNLSILNKVWDRREREAYKWALGDDATSEEAQKWRDQLESWQRKNVRCTVDWPDPADWDYLMQQLTPHLGSVILSRAAAAAAPWSCDP